MNTLTLYALVLNGKETLFNSRSEAVEEQLWLELVYNIHTPVIIVERDYVDEQLVNERRTTLN